MYDKGEALKTHYLIVVRDKENVFLKYVNT